LLRDWKDKAMRNLFEKKLEKQRLEVGHRVYLSGGYNMKPAWLGDSDGYSGEVIAFIPGKNEKSAAVVNLDSPIQVEKVRGNIVVLELRFAGEEWSESEVVNVELCDFMPEAKRWQDRRQGLWVESHADYKIINP
jgi:hypothetical protein